MPALLQAWASGEKRKIEAREGRNVLELTIVPILSRGYINLYGRDVTEEKSLSEKFLQAQKMEAIGRLAGGIAHDFNNLLTVIGGYCALMQEELAEGSPMRGQADEIHRATKQAAALTTQLLAFSRKQVLIPRVIDPTALVQAIENILSRLVGEDIELRTFFSPEAGNIKADSGQIEQVLMNLVVNARDAMPEGGKLTIEISNRTLDDAYAQEHPGVKSGEYVRLAVSDTGHGMDREVLSHVFEPFFTTKERGKGTGLGLSTVYGIVKQSDGYITCYSEPGKGTSFTIYFPRTAEIRDRTAAPLSSMGTLRGSETILLVEDQEMVRRFTKTLLENNGYTVIGVPGGQEALAAIEAHKCEFAMLVTDVVMPQMSGRELAQKLVRACPKMKVLFVSGYTGNAIVHRGTLDPGIDFMQKPFDSREFLAKIREILSRHSEG
jgi:signal transduction histidine kinase/ActR/RegA family two-component response regulator